MWTGVKRAAPNAAPARLSGADKRARMRADARARLAASPSEKSAVLPVPQLHPMLHVLLPPPSQQQQQQQLSHVKQEAHVKTRGAIKDEGDEKVKLSLSAAAQPVKIELPAISMGSVKPVHITFAAGASHKAPLSGHGRSSRASNSNGNCADRSGSPAPTIGMPAVKAEGRSTAQHSPQLNSVLQPFAKQSPTAKSESQPIKDQRTSAQPSKPNAGGKRHSRASTPLRPPSLPVGKAATAQPSLFEPLPMSRAEKLRRGLLSSSRS